MLANKLLQAYGYIFTNSIDPNYLISLINLDSLPIVIKKYGNHKQIVVLSHYWITDSFHYQKYKYLENYEICNISDIKKLLTDINYYFPKNNITKYYTNIRQFMIRYHRCLLYYPK